MASLQLKLLGGFTARLSSGQAVEVSARKNQALLAYLGMNANNGSSREKLVNLLWSNRDDSHARSSLRQALFTLRRSLAGIDPPPFVFSGDIISANAAAISTDVARFERLVASGSVADLRLAAELYEGDLLDGVVIRDSAFQEWLTIERNRLHEVIIGVLQTLLQHLDGAEAIVSANRLVTLDQLREPSHRTLMQIYAAQGQFEPAIRQYHICRRVLWRDLHITPTGETEDLYREITQRRNRPSGASETRVSVTGHGPLAALSGTALPPGLKVVAADVLDSQSEGRPSIAVLPFANMSGDPAQSYFSDGITEDIITELCRFRELVAVARESSFQLRGNLMDPRRVAAELGVRFIVVGSVRRWDGGRIRISVQLVEAATGNHLWADRFDSDVKDIFVVQDELVQAIVAKVTGQLRVTEVERLRHLRTNDMSAYDCLLRGMKHAENGSKEEVRRAIYWFEKALEHEPDYASALALLAGYKSQESLFQQSAEVMDQALSMASRAVALDPNNGLTHAALAIIHLDGLSHGRGSHAIAAQELETASRLNPNEPRIMVQRALQYTYSGRPDAALRLMEKAERLNPSCPNWYLSIRGFELFGLRRYAEAVETFKRVTLSAYWDHYYLAACYANSGQASDARLQIAKSIAQAPFLTLSSFSRRTWYENYDDLQHALDSLRRAGLPD
jgi:TolB-like protein/DNA-binding SARP family transcriptional activator/tetratricopeptide (TPR) repeat protein